jgi:geranylgeranyl reductase family protein
MIESWDVIIVGAGPAGATAAYYLRRAGKKVLLLEKEQPPRYKACGGGLAPRFLAQNFDFPIPAELRTPVRAFTYAYKGHQVTVPVPYGRVSMVMRDRFDAYLLEQARVEVRTGVKVSQVEETRQGVHVATHTGQVFQASYLIGADGANSRVARSLGLRHNRQLAGAIEVEVPAPSRLLRSYAGRPAFIFGELRKGYLWIFPKQGHLSVGIAAIGAHHPDLKGSLQKVMARYGIDLAGAPLHGHPIPIYRRPEPITTRRALLVGDAAGLVDPFSGEGIRYAIKSGRLAAQAVASGRVDRYPGLVFRHIGLNHILARLMANFFYNLQGLCLLLGAPNPFTTRAILDLLEDRIGTVQVMLRALLTLPVFPFTEITTGLAGILGGSQREAYWRSRIYFGADRHRS